MWPAAASGLVRWLYLRFPTNTGPGKPPAPPFIFSFSLSVFLKRFGSNWLALFGDACLGVDADGVGRAAAVAAVGTLVEVHAALAVLRRELETDALDARRAREARRAGVAAVARLQVDAAHSRVARLRKVTLPTPDAHTPSTSPAILAKLRTWIGALTNFKQFHYSNEFN